MANPTTMKPKDTLFLCVILFAYTLSSAQTPFYRVISGWGIDRSNAGHITSDNGYILAGGNLIKADYYGQVEWVKDYHCDFYGVQQTQDKGYIAVGMTTGYGPGPGGQDFYLVRTDSIGDTLWTRTYGEKLNDWPYSIIITSDSGYVIAGTTVSNGTGPSSAYIIRTDQWGDTLWTRTVGSTGYDVAKSVIQSSDGCFVLTGTTGINTVHDDVFLIKLNDLGDTVWTRTLGGNDADYSYDLIQTSEGGYAIIAGTLSFASGGGGDVYFIKTDSLGYPEWSRTYGGLHVDEGNKIRQTPDGGYILAGRMQGYSGGGGNCFPIGPCYDVYLIRTSETGDTLWTRTYGENDVDWAYVLEITADTGFIIGGQTGGWGNSIAGTLLIKTDKSGNVNCNQYNTNTVVGEPTTNITGKTFFIGSGALIAAGGALVDTPFYVNDSLFCQTIVGEEELMNTNNDVLVYPNPFEETATMSLVNPEHKSYDLSLYNSMGSRVRFMPGITGETVVIDSENLQNGIYFYTLTLEGNPIASGKLVLK